MENKTLEVKVRTELGKGATHALRRAGQIPSIIYGHQEPIAVAINAREFNAKFKIISESVLIDLNIDGDSRSCIVKDYQENAMKGTIEHIDFYEVERGKALKTHVPVHVEGTPAGVKEGGIFESALHEVEIECLPKDLPEMITVDVSHLEIGHSIHIGDIAEIPGVKILATPDALVCTVVRKKEVKETTEDELLGGVAATEDKDSEE